jgi:hypothetical protein
MTTKATHHKPEAAARRRALYDGQEKLGELEQDGQEYRAYDRRGQALGVYDSAHEAIAAIAEAAS